MSCILIAGLGNPGVKYRKTRHNIGFMVLDSLAQHLGLAFESSSKFKAELATTQANGTKLFLLKPQTFMNLSGESIAPFIRYHNITHTLVIHDELDCALGDIRFKFGGSSGGHNGLKSIDSHFGSEYFRLRFGISRPQAQSVIEYVLGDFSPQEKAQGLDELIAHATNACLAFISHASDSLSHAALNARDSKGIEPSARLESKDSKHTAPSPKEREILHFLQNTYTRKARAQGLGQESRRDSKQASTQGSKPNLPPMEESRHNPKYDSKRDFTRDSKPTPNHALESKPNVAHNATQGLLAESNQAHARESQLLETKLAESKAPQSQPLESPLDSKDSRLPHPAGEW